MELAENPSLALEALVFASDGPASVAFLRRALPDLTPSRIAELVDEINRVLSEQGRPYAIAAVAGGYQFRTRPEFGELLRAAQPERKTRLSRAAMETLAVIAYRQPLTRPEIEEIRCVDCGAVLKGLMDRELVRIVGRRDAPGRPALFGTTSAFLELFGLRSLADLPPLREIESMIQESGAPGLGRSAEGEALASLDPLAEDAEGGADVEDADAEDANEEAGASEADAEAAPGEGGVTGECEGDEIEDTDPHESAPSS